ncbi:hypothetical protein MJC1_04139 [Methylocystis sp. MJC1]|jgi:Leucine-rich repeat (LRR) protein|nr:hypothetical protein MJC1_04139 [Methylocystis sp. MJC1]
MLAGCSSIDELQVLNKLVLRGTKITDLPSVKDLPSLMELVLHRSPISHITSLQANAMIEHLNFHGTKIVRHINAPDIAEPRPFKIVCNLTVRF